ncbi:NADH-quinone oxidoreductase subunit H [bacterium]|nr:NADH-quinone oxidoreductase subunit H [bacterium]
MSDFLGGILAFLVWPGLLSAVFLAWFYMWLGRKLIARFQGRQGPPLIQPIYDFIKLMGKKTLLPEGVSSGMYFALPLISLLSVLVGLALIPAPGATSISFNGDLIFLLYVLEMPALIDIMAGYTSRSVYAQVGAAREALLSLGHNIPFLIAFIALAVQAQSTNLQTIASTPFGLVHVFAILAILLALPGRIKTTPFSIPNAEQEVIAGPHVEFTGPALAVFEITHGLEVVALGGMLASMFSAQIASLPLAVAVYLLVVMLVVGFTSLLAASTARISIQNALKFYWRWGTIAAAGAILVAVI